MVWKMRERGYFRLGSWQRADILVHWTLPIGALIFGGFAFRPVFWLAFFLLILAHEMGHAVVVRHFGYRVNRIDVSGFGGLCHWSGAANAYERSVIAWGGVGAQAVLFALANIWIWVMGPPHSSILAELLYALVRTNLWLMVINLIPVPPLDGAEAWRVFRLLPERWRRGRNKGTSQGWRKPQPGKHPDPHLKSWWTSQVESRQNGPSKPAGTSEDRGAGKGQSPKEAELAEMFRGIADEARKARGNGSKLN